MPADKLDELLADRSPKAVADFKVQQLQQGMNMMRSLSVLSYFEQNTTPLEIAKWFQEQSTDLALMWRTRVQQLETEEVKET